MFRPDLPIRSKREDLLSRAKFSFALADALLGYEHTESVVTAIYGDWGSGKSSVVNLVLERVEERAADLPKERRPIVLRFNPWNYSDQNQLIGQFFRALSVALRKGDPGEDAKKAGQQLEVYAEFFKPLALIPEPTGLVAGVSTAAALVFKTVGVAASRWGKLKSADLEGMRRDLDRLLAKQQRKILIVIDDIDRLNSGEIRQIFQLVKSLGDFPNTIYLLAFAREIVVKALTHVQEGSGDDYLEKIVQVPFQLPKVSSEEVHKLLFSLLDELVKDVPEGRWDQTYWGNLFEGGLRYFFKSVRDVLRYVNALRFAYPMVADEVSPIDFLAITAIQVFEPAVFDGIRDNPDLFAGLLETGFGDRDSSREQAQKRCDEVIERSVILSKEQQRELLGLLFPKVESIYERMGYSSDHLLDWRASGRVSSPDKFATFFRLAVPVGEIPETEMRSIIGLAQNPETFAEAVLGQIDSGRAGRFMERLQDYTREQIPLEYVQNVGNVFMDIGDLLPEGQEGGIFERDTSMQVMRVLYQLSQRYTTHDERFQFFHEAIEKAERSLYTVVREVGLQGQQHGKGRVSGEVADPEDRRSVTPDQLVKLERQALGKIEDWANSGRLGTHHNLASILFSWRRLSEDSEEKLRLFVADLIKTDEGLVNFVKAFESKSFTQGFSDRVGRFEYHISLKSLEEFVDVKVVEPLTCPGSSDQP